MTTLFGLLASFVFFGALLICPVAWCCGVYYLFRTVNATVHGRTVWKPPTGVPWLFYNPFNRILDASQLTPEGLRYRRRLLLSVEFFVFPILAAFLFAALGGIIH